MFLSQIWKCRKSCIFGANTLGQKCCWCYSFAFCKLISWAAQENASAYLLECLTSLLELAFINFILSCKKKVRQKVTLLMLMLLLQVYCWWWMLWRGGIPNICHQQYTCNSITSIVGKLVIVVMSSTWIWKWVGWCWHKWATAGLA